MTPLPCPSIILPPSPVRRLYYPPPLSVDYITPLPCPSIILPLSINLKQYTHTLSPPTPSPSTPPSHLLFRMISKSLVFRISSQPTLPPSPPPPHPLSTPSHPTPPHPTHLLNCVLSPSTPSPSTPSPSTSSVLQNDIQEFGSAHLPRKQTHPCDSRRPIRLHVGASSLGCGNRGATYTL